MTHPRSTHEARLTEVGARIARIVHEINAPASLISGGLDHLESCFEFLLPGDRGRAQADEHAPDGDRLAYSSRSVPEVLRICRDAVAQLGDLVDDLYAYLRGTSDGPRPLDWIDVGAEMERAAMAALARRRARRRPTVEREIPTGLRIRCTPGAIERVLVNVIGNAFDAVQEKTDGRVSVAGRRIEPGDGASLGWIELEVRDNGPGIPPAIHQKIFEPFFTTKVGGGGLGLGLAIARETVESNGGAIIATTNPDGGASFVMRFPSGPDDPGHSGAGSTPAGPASVGS